MNEDFHGFDVLWPMSQFGAAFRLQEMNLPQTYWAPLSQEDKVEFQKLRASFHQNQKTSTKDRRLVSFANELQTILKYIEHSTTGRENRTILVGVCFSGPFIGVNTRQLKCFMGRCKSSINGSFQQLGYVALKTKSKSRTCILSILPSLAKDPNILRQWTVRIASDAAQVCFVSSLRSIQMSLPTITEEDINEDKKNVTSSSLLMPRSMSMTPSASLSSLSTLASMQAQGQLANLSMRPPPPIQMGTSMNDIVVPDNGIIVPEQEPMHAVHDMSTSYSVDSFDGWGDARMEYNYNEGDHDVHDWNPVWDNQSTMPRSQSAVFDADNDFSLF